MKVILRVYERVKGELIVCEFIYKDNKDIHIYVEELWRGRGGGGRDINYIYFEWFKWYKRYQQYTWHKSEPCLSACDGR